MTYSDQTHQREGRSRRTATIGRPTQEELLDALGRRGLGLVAATPPAHGAVLDAITGMLHPARYRAGDVVWLAHRGDLGRTRLEDLVLRAGTRVAWNCTADAAMARRFSHPEFGSCARVVPPPIDTAVFRPEPPTGAEPWTEDPFRDRPVLLHTGRFHPEKRIDQLIRLAELLVERTDALLVLVGSFPPDTRGLADAARFQRDIRDLGLRDHVTFLGRVADPMMVAALMRRATVAVNLTVNHDESYGFAQVEAAACGTPVVGAGWGGLRDTVGDETGHQVTTLITDHGTFVDVHEAVEAVATFLDDPERREASAMTAAAWARQHSWDAFVAAVLALVEEPPAALPGLGRVASVSELVAAVMAPALAGRWEPARNRRLDSLSVDDYVAVRNRPHLGVEEQELLALFDDLDDFRRRHYRFLLQDYASCDVETAVARLGVEARLHPLVPSVIDTVDGVAARDAVFGRRDLRLEPIAVSVARAVIAEPGLTPRHIAEKMRIEPAEVLDHLSALVAGGLVIPAAS
ncbi:MAG: glycosyltransferase family 4 protein [Acidimicrobiales bacterium]